MLLTAVVTVLAVLNAGAHADDKIEPAIVAAIGNNSIPVDYDPSGSSVNVVAQSNNAGGDFLSVATNAPANHATYAVINASYCCYGPLMDQDDYATLLAQGTVYTSPLGLQVGGALPAGTAPPVALVSTSSQNSSNGGSGWGVEFGLSTSYKGLDTTEDSWTSAALAGFLAALKSKHPGWNWFDAKAALRQTAANWATGYDHRAFGYGFINWDAANDVGAVFLQPPGLQVANNRYFAQVTLLPYRQSRRSVERVYSVNATYVWPMKNEYTTADVAASGATLLFTSNGSDTTPTFSYAPAASGTVTFVAFTLDGNGGFSRVEEFSKVAVTLTVGTACTQ